MDCKLCGHNIPVLHISLLYIAKVSVNPGKYLGQYAPPPVHPENPFSRNLMTLRTDIGKVCRQTKYGWILEGLAVDPPPQLRDARSPTSVGV